MFLGGIDTTPPQLMTAKAGRVAFWIYYIYIYVLGEIDTTPPQPMTSNTQPPPKRPPGYWSSVVGPSHWSMVFTK